MNLPLEKRERITMGGKGRGEFRDEVGEVIGVVKNAYHGKPGKIGMERLVDVKWLLEKGRYFWWLVGLTWTEVWKPSLSKYMSVSRKF